MILTSPQGHSFALLPKRMIYHEHSLPSIDLVDKILCSTAGELCKECPLSTTINCKPNDIEEYVKSQEFITKYPELHI